MECCGAVVKYQTRNKGVGGFDASTKWYIFSWRNKKNILIPTHSGAMIVMIVLSFKIPGWRQQCQQ